MLELLRSHLLAMATAYTAATGTNAPTIGKLALNDHNFFRRVRNGDGFTVKSYDRAQTWFDTNWPAGAKWPADVPRPSASVVAA